MWRLFEVGTVIGILESSLITKQEISIWTEAVCKFLADLEPGHLMDSHVQCEQLQGPVLKDPRMLEAPCHSRLKTIENSPVQPLVSSKYLGIVLGAGDPSQRRHATIT